MSRVGKAPVQIPSGVTVVVNNKKVVVTGSKGTLDYTHLDCVEVKVEGSDVVIGRKNEEKFTRSAHGLTRALVANMVTGVSKGFEKKLEIIGVGYRAAVQGAKLNLTLGFSHPVIVDIPSELKISMDEKAKNVIIISGIDIQKVGQFAANIRDYRKPEPYKGKGIRYMGEYVKRKAGKSAAK